MASIANLPSGAQATIAAGLDVKDCTLLSIALASSAVEDSLFPPALLPFLKAAKFPASYQPSPGLWSAFSELQSLDLEGAVSLDGHSFLGLKQLQELKVRILLELELLLSGVLVAACRTCVLQQFYSC